MDSDTYTGKRIWENWYTGRGIKQIYSPLDANTRFVRTCGFAKETSNKPLKTRNNVSEKEFMFRCLKILYFLIFVVCFLIQKEI